MAVVPASFYTPANAVCTAQMNIYKFFVALTKWRGLSSVP